MGENKTPQELDFERKHEEYLHRIQNLRLIDDNFMTKVFEDKECSEFLLQVILDRDDLTIQETGMPFGDGAHIIYVNSQIKDDTKLGRLMQDFTCTNPDDMNYPVLAQRVRYFKEDTKGVATMCRAFEEVREEALREGERKKALKSALEMLADGVPCDKVAKYTGLTISEVEELVGKKPA